MKLDTGASPLFLMISQFKLEVTELTELLKRVKVEDIAVRERLLWTLLESVKTLALGKLMTLSFQETLSCCKSYHIECFHVTLSCCSLHIKLLQLVSSLHTSQMRYKLEPTVYRIWLTSI